MRFRSTVQLSGKSATGHPRAPDDVVAAMDRGARFPVVVTINGHSYRSTVTPYRGETMLPLSAENRAARRASRPVRRSTSTSSSTTHRARSRSPTTSRPPCPDPRAPRSTRCRSAGSGRSSSRSRPRRRRRPASAGSRRPSPSWAERCSARRGRSPTATSVPGCADSRRGPGRRGPGTHRRCSSWPLRPEPAPGRRRPDQQDDDREDPVTVDRGTADDATLSLTGRRVVDHDRHRRRRGRPARGPARPTRTRDRASTQSDDTHVVALDGGAAVVRLADDVAWTIDLTAGADTVDADLDATTVSGHRARRRRAQHRADAARARTGRVPVDQRAGADHLVLHLPDGVGRARDGHVRGGQRGHRRRDHAGHRRRHRADHGRLRRGRRPLRDHGRPAGSGASRSTGYVTALRSARAPGTSASRTAGSRCAR